ncbi:MAG: glycosyltransferase [Desulforhopalus sp.]
MNICMFTNTYLPHVGGVARSISTFVEDLRKAGLHVRIIVPTFPATPKETDSEIVRIPAIQNFNGSDFSVRIPLPGSVHKAMKNFKPDLIHSHHPFLMGDTALRAARSLDLPLVFTHHTRYEDYTHYVPLDSVAMKRFVIKLATEYANLCHRVIAPSKSIKTLLVERGVRSPVEVLPTGIDVDYFRTGDGARFRREYGIPENHFVIGHVGRLAKEKNLPFLARAVVESIKGQQKTCFLVAGKGDAEREVKDIFSRQHLDSHLLMAGSLTGQKLADCYAAMDIFAFASRSETQGLVLIEAMAASTPVVALSASGVNDVLQHRVNGIKLKEDSSEKDFGAALTETLTDQDQLAFLRRNAVDTADTFSREKTAAQLIALYQRTIDGVQVPHKNEIDMLDGAVMAIKTEWELLQQKTSAAITSFSEEKKARHEKSIRDGRVS